MNIHRFAHEDRESYLVSILVPTLRPLDIKKEYLDPISLNPDYCLAHSLPMRAKGKTPPKSERKDFIENYLMPKINSYRVKYLFVGNSDYFKDLTGCAKSEAMLGYVLDCKYGPQKVIYLPNFSAVFYNPEEIRARIQTGLEAFKSFVSGSYEDPGTGIIKQAHYPKTDEEIAHWLNKLIEMDVPLSIDIEAFDLKHHKAGIGSIAIAWSKHEGVAFTVDYVPKEEPENKTYGLYIRNEERRKLLRSFFERASQRTIYHNIAFDAYVLIYQLYMDHILDTEGLLKGMDILLKNWECTKLISYLATNTCAGNDLSLKTQAQEFAGNWAVEEIKDITKIPVNELLQYNLVDALSSMYVLEKNEPIMEADQQRGIYERIFKPATLDIIQMQLTGMPVHMPTVLKIEPIMIGDRDRALQKLQESDYVKEATEKIRYAWIENRNSKLKVKRVGMEEAIASGAAFNPDSDQNCQLLLFEVMGLPVLDKTASGAPSVSGDVIKALLHHAKEPQAKATLQALIDFAAVSKIITTYITALKNAAPGNDGWHYLFGSFNLGGTVSGRLSSSKINLQNLPVKGKYGKLIKSCFMAPPKWLFTGLDFNALEARIDALITKDEAKLKIYTDGYDSHSYNTYGYWPERFSDIRVLDEKDPRRVFKVTIQGKVHLLVEGDLVKLPDGSTKRIEEVCMKT